MITDFIHYIKTIINFRAVACDQKNYLIIHLKMVREQSLLIVL